MNIINATELMSQTLVGYYTKSYPMDEGNCFSVMAEDGQEYSILNFGAENLQHLQRKGLIWPIKIATLSPRHAVIHDERIGDRWYQKRFCEVCTPRELLPLPQRLVQLRMVCRGQRKESENGWVSFTIGDIAHKAQFE